MIKDERKKQYQKDYMKEYQRKKRGLNKEEPGSKQIVGLADGSKQITPDIIDKLTSPFWRPRLERLCAAFSGSPYAKDVRVGVYGLDLETVSELLSATEGIPVVQGEPVLTVTSHDVNIPGAYTKAFQLRRR